MKNEGDSTDRHGMMSIAYYYIKSEVQKQDEQDVSQHTTFGCKKEGEVTCVCLTSLCKKKREGGTIS